MAVICWDWGQHGACGSRRGAPGWRLLVLAVQQGAHGCVQPNSSSKCQWKSNSSSYFSERQQEGRLLLLSMFLQLLGKCRRLLLVWISVEVWAASSAPEPYLSIPEKWTISLGYRRQHCFGERQWSLVVRSCLGLEYAWKATRMLLSQDFFVTQWDLYKAGPFRYKGFSLMRSLWVEGFWYHRDCNNFSYTLFNT